MPAPSSFDYAIIRVVPRVEREEFINAGVILFCRTRRFLGARLALNWRRLAALDAEIDPAEVEQHLALIPLLCNGDLAAGPLAALPQADRFHWLIAPRSSVIQCSPVHTGLCTDPQAALNHLLKTIVCLPESKTLPI
ncbi:MAG: DUF3037 domain-containing protein [Anaerolineae bacterium]